MHLIPAAKDWAPNPIVHAYAVYFCSNTYGHTHRTQNVSSTLHGNNSSISGSIYEERTGSGPVVNDYLITKSPVSLRIVMESPGPFLEMQYLSPIHCLRTGYPPSPPKSNLQDNPSRHSQRVKFTTSYMRLFHPPMQNIICFSRREASVNGVVFFSLHGQLQLEAGGDSCLPRSLSPQWLIFKFLLTIKLQLSRLHWTPLFPPVLPFSSIWFSHCSRSVCLVGMLRENAKCGSFTLVNQTLVHGQSVITVR